MNDDRNNEFLQMQNAFLSSSSGDINALDALFGSDLAIKAAKVNEVNEDMQLMKHATLQAVNIKEEKAAEVEQKTKENEAKLEAVADEFKAVSDSIFLNYHALDPKNDPGPLNSAEFEDALSILRGRLKKEEQEVKWLNTTLSNCNNDLHHMGLSIEYSNKGLLDTKKDKIELAKTEKKIDAMEGEKYQDKSISLVQNILVKVGFEEDPNSIRKSAIANQLKKLINFKFGLMDEIRKKESSATYIEFYSKLVPERLELAKYRYQCALSKFEQTKDELSKIESLYKKFIKRGGKLGKITAKEEQFLLARSANYKLVQSLRASGLIISDETENGISLSGIGSTKQQHKPIVDPHEMLVGDGFDGVYEDKSQHWRHRAK